MSSSTHVPPGFRFHPTDEELVDYYLRRKMSSRRFDLDIIKEVDLYKIEPWDLQEICKLGDDEQNEWYFFSHKDKKYPTGTRTNRATAEGFWKATGRDKAIYSKHQLIGMRKTLVFYKGRAPNGHKSDWIMHEYRLETDQNGPPQEEGWAVCRVFKKKTPTTMRRISEHESPSYWYDDQVSLMSSMDSPRHCQSNNILNTNPTYSSNRVLDSLPFQIPQEQLIHLPIVQTSKILMASSQGTSICNNALVPYDLDVNRRRINRCTHQVEDNQNASMVLISSNNQIHQQGALDQLTDWRVLDKFVASQLSQEDVSKGMVNNYSSTQAPSSRLSPTGPESDHLNKEESTPEHASQSS